MATVFFIPSCGCASSIWSTTSSARFRSRRRSPAEGAVLSSDSARSFSMMFVLPEFWGPSHCIRIRTAMDRGRASQAEIYADGYRVDEEVRRAFEVDVDDEIVEEVQRAMDGARSKVAQCFDTQLVGEEGPGFLRYVPGGFYGVHRDLPPGWDG